MDPNSHHGFIGNTEDRSIPMYYNKTNDDLTHSQIYPKAASMNKKQCLCTSVAGNGTCNMCRNQTTEINWKINQYDSNVEYGSKDGNNCQQESAMYVHSHHHQSYNNKGIDISINKPYWTQNKQNHSEELAMTNKKIVPTHLEVVHKPPLGTKNNYSLENVNFQYEQPPQQLQQQQQQQQRHITADFYCKDRCSYEEKYRLKDETCRSSKVDFMPLANNTVSMYNMGNQNSIKIEAARTNIVDQQIVNPSNMLASKEQQPSPNYARKCPQIFSNAEHNSCHSNLYVSPPQFSSEKFTNINSQQKIFRESPMQEYRTYESTTPHSLHIHPDNINHRESPMKTSSPIMAFTPTQSNYPPMINDQQPSRGSQHYSYAANPVRNTNYYVPSISKVDTPEMSPIIVKQTHTPHQYSKSILPPPTSHLMPQKAMQRVMEDCVKKEEDPFDMHASSNRNLYINPFNTGIKNDDCCIKQSTSFTPKQQTLCKNEPTNNYLKYNKCSLNSMSSNKPSSEIVNQNPQQNHSSAYSRSAYYYENQSLRYENNAHNMSSSPAVAATAASPLPATSQTHTPLHHNTYVTQPQSHHMQNMEQYQLQPQQTELDRQNSKRHDFRGGGGGGGLDVHETQPARARINTMHKSIQQTLTPQPQLQQQQQQQQQHSQAQQSTKKSQATKPNYRELINHVYAMRNSTSEEELNLQIIKKALNVDAQINRPPVVAQVPVQMNAQNEKQSYIAPSQYPIKDAAPVRMNISSGFSTKYLHKRTNLVADIPPPVPKAENLLQQIKQEKSSSFSPLDLSMRTIKTKADSTEYSQKSFSASSMNRPNTDCKYTLPRVDFTPNFSLHAKNTGTNSVRNMQLAQAEKRQHVMQSIPKLGYDIHNQAGQVSLQRPAASSMVATNVVRFETHPKVDSYQRAPTSANLVPVAPSTTEPVAIEMLKNKLLPRACGPQNVFQTRPSVLEANPYAQPKLQSLKSHKEPINTISVVDQLPPDTSIMVLPKANLTDAPQVVENELKPQTAYSLACERNPNFLGRKRHLHEYNTNAKYTEPPLNKLPRLQEPKTIILPNSPGLTQPIDVKMVETPKVAELIIPPEVAVVKAVESVADMMVCKQEPATPTAETAPITPVPIKSEATAIIASRIRTKAELKGFTFNALPKENTCFKEVKIKVEPITPSELPIDLPCIPGLVDERSQSSLLDFDWSTACNDFVEQLLTNTKKRTIKKKVQPAPKMEKSNEDPSTATTAERKPTDTVIVTNDVQRINDDSQDCSMSTVDSTVVLKTATCRTEANDSAMTLKSISQESAYQPTVIQKKTSKVEREKMRSQQEKRLAARLQKESSSESENEVNKRLTERLKKPLKRAKIRGLASDKKRFSDCGSDSSDSDDLDDQDEPASKSIKQQKNVNDVNQQAEQRLSESNNNEEQITNKSNVIIENKKENQNLFKEESNQPKSLLNEDDASTAESEREDLATKLVDEPQRKQCSHEVHTGKKVQYANVSNKDNNIFSKQIRKPKLHSKMIGLNTMTRSKRKRELEMQLANSKVLRNDKIIRNSTTKIKRKYVRKFSNNMKQSAGSKDRKEQEQLMSTRLRSKNEKQLANNHNSLSNPKRVVNKKKHDGILNKEQQTDLFLEVYRYKRSLKIPASLISIKHPSNQRISSSLPDLEKNLEEPSSSSTTRKPKVIIKKHALISKKELGHSKLTNTTPLKVVHSEEPKSIIDLLHSRVINSSVIRPTKVKTTKANTSTSSIHTLSETSQTTESNSIGLGELLPTPKKPENIDATANDGKKRHFSIFDTKVLQTKTRTESKLQQKKEIIREIFVGDDRPASAPPEMTQALDGGEKMTYEQKYEQFLQQMNIVINEEKLLKFGRATTSITTSSALKDKVDPLKLGIKEEEVDEKLDNEHLQDNVSTVSGTTSCFRRRRPAKYLRRKGSSGFDYIRKKKKPTPSAGSNNALLHPIIKTERIDEYDFGKIKTESDVGREIQKWVLNKGVGQSTMHKAARLGYIDVIVYCLDRMGLNPDQKDNAGYTPLHEACTNGWLEIAKILLQYGANHSEAAHSGIRPLHEASENDNLEIVRMLLSYGADPLLATYSGQTPLMLASSNSMKELIKEHLNDVQALGTQRKPWRFNGPWHIFDETENGFNIFGGVPTIPCDVSKALRKSNIISNKKLSRKLSGNSTQPITNSCAVLLDNIDHFNSVRLYNETKKTDPKPATSVDQSQFLIENSDSDGEMFEFEEADVLLPPLYLLKDEGMDKWVLLSDLCNLLKVKSKDTLLNKIYPSSSISSSHKSLMRELKMSDFLEKATCLQLLCAGEKINICASKVVLIKYNDNVRNLLGVKTILMKF